MELDGAAEPKDASTGVDPNGAATVEPKPCGPGAGAPPNPGTDAVGAEPN